LTASGSSAGWRRRAACGLVACGVLIARGAGTSGDVALPPGPNYAVAAFRWWQPADAGPLRGVLVLVPGSNSDGCGQVAEPFWQEFARRHQLALVGCEFRDHPHANMNIEDYARAGDGSGQALLDGIARLAADAGQPEAARAPLLLWGISAGGEFNYEFSCWQPARVAAFVVNKGGFYFTHLAPAPARAVPGIFFVGGRDETFRIQSIQGIFAVNRRAGAAWQLVVEPEVGHDVGRSRELAADFFAGVLALRR
jgi:dienelactone hydrolase